MLIVKLKVLNDYFFFKVVWAQIVITANLFRQIITEEVIQIATAIIKMVTRTEIVILTTNEMVIDKIELNKLSREKRRRIFNYPTNNISNHELINNGSQYKKST